MGIHFYTEFDKYVYDDMQKKKMQGNDILYL